MTMTVKIALCGNLPAGTKEAFEAKLVGEDVAFVACQTAEEFEALSEADVIVLRTFKGPAPVFERVKGLKLLCRWGAGVDNVDLAAAAKHGVLVTNAPGANAYSVAELAVTLMLNVGRNIMFHEKSVQSGVWSKSMFAKDAFTLNNKLVGIIGGGNIGRQVATRVQAFGAKTQYFDVFRLKPEMEEKFNLKFVPLNELIRTSDIITLHVPLTPENRHMIGAEQIASMKKGAIVINTARGGLIDDVALANSVSDGHLKGAGLDCVEGEPLVADSPLLGHPNIVITPHIGGTAADLPDVMVPMIAETIRPLLHGGQVPHIVNQKELDSLK